MSKTYPCENLTYDEARERALAGFWMARKAWANEEQSAPGKLRQVRYDFDGHASANSADNDDRSACDWYFIGGQESAQAFERSPSDPIVRFPSRCAHCHGESDSKSTPRVCGSCGRNFDTGEPVEPATATPTPPVLGTRLKVVEFVGGFDKALPLLEQGRYLQRQSWFDQTRKESYIVKVGDALQAIDITNGYSTAWRWGPGQSAILAKDWQVVEVLQPAPFVPSVGTKVVGKKGADPNRFVPAPGAVGVVTGNTAESGRLLEVIFPGHGYANNCVLGRDVEIAYFPEIVRKGMSIVEAVVVLPPILIGPDGDYVPSAHLRAGEVVQVITDDIDDQGNVKVMRKSGGIGSWVAPQCLRPVNDKPMRNRNEPR